MSPVAPRRQPQLGTSPPPHLSPPPPSAVEVTYNTAVQAFVRRDHARLSASLARLLALVPALPRAGTSWADADRAQWEDGDEWAVKTLKLYVSAAAMMYADPPKARPASTLAPQLGQLARVLPPAGAGELLEQVHAQCVETYFGRAGAAGAGSAGAPDGQRDSTPAPTSARPPTLLPPPLVSTLLLAALKLPPPALDFAHRLAETWIVDLPDDFIVAVSRPGGTGAGNAGAGNAGAGADGAERRRRLESAREGYLKVVELFVGEVLCREEEWGMAKGFLEGEVVMGIKRKEALYKHIRARQHARDNPHPPSPAASGLLPLAPSASLGPANTNGTGNGRRSRASSLASSSSSSERTARPAGLAAAAARPHARAPFHPALAPEAADVDAGPSRARVPEKPAAAPALSTALMRAVAPLRAHLPVDRIAATLQSQWVRQLALPLPLILLLALLVRRKFGGTRAVDLGDRLRRARRESMREWATWWLRWWWAKLVGVWQLGTTITYL
ncbi:hypothetical protein Q5752_002909 [Cryptotrichosporon argae]